MRVIALRLAGAVADIAHAVAVSAISSLPQLTRPKITLDPFQTTAIGHEQPGDLHCEKQIANEIRIAPANPIQAVSASLPF